MCGVGSQLVPSARIARAGSVEQAAADVWAPRRAPVSSLGGRGPQYLVEHLCLPCDDAAVRAGAMWPTALESALVGHLRPDLAGRLPYGMLRLDGVVGWGVLVAQAQRRTESPTPGEPRRPHLPRLGDLTEQVGRALG